MDTALTATSAIEKELAAFFPPAFACGMQYAKGKGLPHHSAEEAVENAFLELTKLWMNIAPEEKTIPFFMSIVRERTRDEHRRGMRDEARHLSFDVRNDAELMYPMHEPKSVLAVCEDRSDYEVVRKVIDTLSPQLREVLLRCEEEGMTPAELAEESGRNVKTVRNQLAIAKRQVRERMKQRELSFARKALRSLPRSPMEVVND